MKNKKWVAKFLATLVFFQCSYPEKKFAKAYNCSILTTVLASAPFWLSLIVMAYNRLKAEYSFDRTEIIVNPNRIKDLYVNLTSNVLGQGKAIDDIMKIIAGKSGTKVIFLIGPSGTGKSETIRYVNQYLYNGNKDLNPSSIVSGSDYVGTPPEEVKKFVLTLGGNFAHQITRNPNTLMLFDAVDKFPPEFLAILQNLLDGDRIPLFAQLSMNNVAGGRTNAKTFISVNTKGLLLFLISNETLEGLGRTGGKLTQKLVAEGKFTTEQEALIWLQKLPWEERKALLREEYGESRTIIQRDLSLSNRFPVIEFADLSIETLSNIFLKFFNDYNDDGSLILSPDVTKKIATIAKKSGRGARAVNEIFANFVGTHKLYTGFEKTLSHKKTMIKFDSEKNEFSFYPRSK